MKKLALSLLAIVMLSACSVNTFEKSITVEENATAVGPFFSGPNSMVADVKVDYTALSGKENATSEHVISAMLTGASLSFAAEDSLEFSAVSSASIQVVSEKLPMKRIALLNPVETSDNTIALNLSSENELREYFQAGAYSIVVDLDLKDDLYVDELTIEVGLNFDFKFAEN